MSKFSWGQFDEVPVIGIIRNMKADDVYHIADSYASAGFSTLEVTLNTSGVAEMLHELGKRFGDSLNIGAGTVCTVEDFDLAVEAGAGFIVTPVINEAVIAKAVSAGLPIFPGAYTPSEIYRAWSLGAPMIKLFPATGLGADYIREVLAPLDKVQLLPTGGVSFENCESFFKAGARGVGMGSHLFPKDLINGKKWNDLKNLYTGQVAIIKRIKTAIAKASS